MGGCTNCGGKAGCDHRKGDMFARLDDALAALYPTQTWGEFDPAAVAPPDLDLAALAEELRRELDAEVVMVDGDDDDFADYLYVMCFGRLPSLCAAWAHGHAPARAELESADDGPVRELHLRIAISRLAPMAAVQQVEFTGELLPDGMWISVHERNGVYDAPLLPRMQRLVAILPAYDLCHVDFGEISAPRPGWHAGTWSDAYPGAAAEPDVSNFLFSAAPAGMTASTWLAWSSAATTATSATSATEMARVPAARSEGSC